jgi:hypothetical protein
VSNFSLQHGVLALPGPCDVALRGDPLTLLRSLPGGCTPLVFFHPQYRGVLDNGRKTSRPHHENQQPPEETKKMGLTQ